jgi:hypothetical protein
LTPEFLAGERFALHEITISRAVCAPMPITAAASGAIVGVRIGRALIALFLGYECLSVSDRDLVVVRVYFRERQKPVAIATVVHESRLQGRFNACDLGEVNITAKLLAVGTLEIEFFDAVAA